MPSSKRPPSPRAAMDSDEDADALALALAPAPAPAAADDDGLAASPPRSRKRSSRPSSGRRSPNPNPRPRPDLYGSEPSRKSERKRKPRYFPDAAPLSHALAAPASLSRGGGGSVQLWTDADELALLAGAVAFRAGSGRAPRLPDTGPLFESIRDSLSDHITSSAKVYYKLKRLKAKFCNPLPSAATASTPHDRRVRDLSAHVWGPDLAPPPAEDAEEEDSDDEEEEPDQGYAAPAEVAVGAARLPLVTELLGEHWRKNARALSGVSLEKGLAQLGAEEGRVAEARWRQQLDAEMRTQVRRHDLAKEVFGLLIDTIKGLGP